MTKLEVITLFLKTIYSYDKKVVISKKEIKKLENHFKNNIGKFRNVDEFKNSDSQIDKILSRRDVKGVKSEIDKQLKNKFTKGLQPGILSECNMVQTLAKVLNLRNYKDLEEGGIADIPKALYEVIKPKQNTICAGRYAYYNKDDDNNFLVQYGNPKMADACAILYSHDITIEIKDVPALLMDRDLIYDDNGKIIITDAMIEEFPKYVKYIEKFNKETSIIEKYGSNYPLFNNESDLSEKQELIEDYFESTSADVILTTIKDELVAIRTEDLNFVFKDGMPLIDISKSEIRTTGKNSVKNIFTPELFQKVLLEKKLNIVDGVCRIYKNNENVIGVKKGRGKNIYTRYCINNTFYISITQEIRKQLNDDSCDYIDIRVDDIKQTKSGISLHIDIKKTKEMIHKELYPY